MPPKRDIPDGAYGLLMELRLLLQENPEHPTTTKIEWYKRAKEKHGRNTAEVALWLFEANIPTNRVANYFTGDSEVTQNNNPGGQSITQRAGGDMTGVNAGGTQTIRDITIYKQ